MGHYTSRLRARQSTTAHLRYRHPTLLLALALLASSCAGLQATAARIEIQVEVDGRSAAFPVASGSTVQQALASVGVELGELDRVSPPVFTVLTQPATIRITRVRERFEVQSDTLAIRRSRRRSGARVRAP